MDYQDYTFGRPVETYVTPIQHLALLKLRSSLEGRRQDLAAAAVTTVSLDLPPEGRPCDLPGDLTGVDLANHLWGMESY